MNDGRLTRLAILSLLLLAPFAGAAPPSANLSSAESADGQDITDMAADPSGQFVAAVVAFDNAKAATGLGLPGTSPAHDDIYRCDFGPSQRPTSGSGCRGLRHDSNVITAATQPPAAPQRVAATSVDANGRQGVFAVVGPDRYVSLWRTTSDQPDWTRSTEDGYPAVNVTMARDASRVFVGTAPASLTAGGRVEARFGNNGTLAWMLPLENPEGAQVRPSSLDHSRAANGVGTFVLAIGTNDGVLFADPGSPTRPSVPLGALDQPGAVSKVQLSGDGKYVVVGASNGVFLATLERSGTRIVPVANAVYNRGFGGTAAQDVAISMDGSRFAAAAGNEIHFFRRLDTGGLAEPTGAAYNAGARVADIAYDEKGQILVAIAGNKVFAFGPNKNTPIWEFDATQSAFGSLDGPLRRVSVSEDSQRILVAGKTKVMAYSSVLSVSATLASSTGVTSLQPTQSAMLSLKVTNTGSLPDNYTFSVVAPVGWASTSAEGVKLDPGEERTVQFNVTAPPGQAPGIYGTQVRVRSQATDDLAAIRNQPTGYLAGPSFNFTVPRSVVLKLEAPDDRVLLRQGGEQTIAFTLRNEGNAEGIVNLSARQELSRGSSWDVRFAPSDQVVVAPSSTASVNVVIRPLSDAGSGDRNIITLRAREGELVEATDQITAYVDAQFGAELRAHPTAWEFYPGQTHIIRVNVTNAGNTEDVYNLTHTLTPTAVQSDWRVTMETLQITVARGETKSVVVSVKAVASDAREATLMVRAISQNSPERDEASLPLSLVTIPRPPTDEEKGFLPTPGVWAALSVVALAALMRRGGKR